MAQSKKNTQESAEETHKENLNYKRKELKNTPFTVISDFEKGEHYAVMGDYRLTEAYKDAKSAEQAVKKITWNRLIQVILILDELKNKRKELVK